MDVQFDYRVTWNTADYTSGHGRALGAGAFAFGCVRGAIVLHSLDNSLSSVCGSKVWFRVFITRFPFSSLPSL